MDAVVVEYASSSDEEVQVEVDDDDGVEYASSSDEEVQVEIDDDDDEEVQVEIDYKDKQEANTAASPAQTASTPPPPQPASKLGGKRKMVPRLLQQVSRDA